MTTLRTDITASVGRVSRAVCDSLFCTDLLVNADWLPLAGQHWSAV